MSHECELSSYQSVRSILSMNQNSLNDKAHFTKYTYSLNMLGICIVAVLLILFLQVIRKLYVLVNQKEREKEKDNQKMALYGLDAHFPHHHHYQQQQYRNIIKF